jgi:hypothetical protein
VVRGCRRRRVEHDHRLEFVEGGTGSTANIGLLCSFHHDQKTHRGARLERHGDEWLWFLPVSDHQPSGLDPPEPWRSPIGEHLNRWDTTDLDSG